MIKTVQLQYFKNIGSAPISINLQHKLTVIIGQNNSGKSNILDYLNRLSVLASTIRTGNGPNPEFIELDHFNRDMDNLPLFTIMLDEDSYEGFGLGAGDLPEEGLWFRFRIEKNEYHIDDSSIFELSLDALNRFGAQVLALTYAQIPDRSELTSRLDSNIKKVLLMRVLNDFPHIIKIPAFRKIESTEISSLAKLKQPPDLRPSEKVIFKKILKALKVLLNLPELEIDIPDGKSITLDNSNLMLPLGYYGTGSEEILRILYGIFTNENKLIAIEEPEIHLHPQLQRRLLQYILTNTENSFLVLTHSSSFINTPNDPSIIHIKNVEGQVQAVAVLDNKDHLSVLNDLGIRPSDILLSDYIIWVEGPSDRIYLKKYLSLLRPDLRENEHFVFIFYGSCGHLKHISVADDTDFNGNDIDQINLMSINPRCAVIIDSDKKAADEEPDEIKKRIKQECDSKELKCWITEKRTIENYIPVSVFEEILKEETKVEGKLKIGPFDDFRNKIKEAWPNLRKNYKKVEIAQLVVHKLTLDHADQELLTELKSIGTEIDSQRN